MNQAKDQLQKKIEQVVAETYGESPDGPVTFEQPRQASHGDLATTVALTCAKQFGKPPREIAQRIAGGLAGQFEWLDDVEIAGPGFINFRFGKGYYRELLREILLAGDDFGRTDVGHGMRVQIEFVSANPTGPLNVVSARAASVGDVMASLHNAAGYLCDREYYVNDAGRQVRLLGQSVSARYMELCEKEEPFPEDGYHGEYVRDLARDILEAEGERFADLPADQRWPAFTAIALERIIKAQKDILDKFGVDFQNWFHESSLRDERAQDEVLRKFSEDGLTYEKDGALWFRSGSFGDEKDRVLVTSEGEPTYFLIDIAYHHTKWSRGYEKVVDIWGPDHHGYINRMRAAVTALGHPPETFEVKIVQQVNLLRDGEAVRMSKRAGKLIEMRELVEEVGVDAARFFFLMRKISTHLDFDIELARRETDENPVYYVQYAHARISSILRYAEEQGVALNAGADLSPLGKQEEIDLIKRLYELPAVIERAVSLFEPSQVTTYLQEVASTFHRFYNRCRVVSEDESLTAARLLLTLATRNVLANALGLMGVGAPERM